MCPINQTENQETETDVKNHNVDPFTVLFDVPKEQHKKKKLFGIGRREKKHSDRSEEICFEENTEKADAEKIDDDIFGEINETEKMTAEFSEEFSPDTEKSDEEFEKIPDEEEKTEETEQAEEIEEEQTEEQKPKSRNELFKELFGVELGEEDEEETNDIPEEKIIEIFGDKSNGEEITETDDYVALDDKMTEGTKEFNGRFSSLEAAMDAYVPDEETDENSPVVSDEIVSDSENPYSDNYDDSDDEPKVIEREYLPEDYSAEADYDIFAETLRGKSFKALCTALWTFLLLGLEFYLESVSFSNIYHPTFLSPNGALKAIFYLVDIQLVLISAIIMLQNFSDGIKNIFSGSADRNSVFALTVVVSFIHSACAIAFEVEDAPVFGIIPIAFAFFNAISNSLDTKRIYRSFKIFAAKKTKFVIADVEGECAELEAFKDYIEGDPAVSTTRKTDFVDGFFKNSDKALSQKSPFTSVIIISFVISAIYAGFFIWKGAEVFDIISKFAVMALMTLPLCTALTQIIPFSRISKNLFKKDCAIGGIDSADSISKTDIISLTDEEVLLPKYTKISTIRTYGKTRIDSAILYAAQIFNKLGGPLSQVFKKTITNADAILNDNFDFLEITADGLCAKIDGNEVFIGNKEYMTFYDFGYTNDDIDENFEANNGKIMYMVIGQSLAAKYYIRYYVGTKFRKLITRLSKNGIGVAVQSCDPNVDSALIKNLLQNQDVFLEIIKTTDAMKEAPVLERTESGAVSASNSLNLLDTVLNCSKLIKIIKANSLCQILSVFVGAILLVFMTFIGHTDKITSLFVLIYDLIWLIFPIGTSISERK